MALTYKFKKHSYKEINIQETKIWVQLTHELRIVHTTLLCIWDHKDHKINVSEKTKYTKAMYNYAVEVSVILMDAFIYNLGQNEY